MDHAGNVVSQALANEFGFKVPEDLVVHVDKLDSKD
jgi:hypothetical protein